jgi:hypothetical protein
MRWRKKIIAAGFGLLLACVGFYALHVMNVLAEGSAVSALSAQILESGLPKYYAEFGCYPSTLRELNLDFQAADGASAETLRWIRYRSDGQSFTYVEVGPDRFHRRVWWCTGAEKRGFIDLGQP